MRTNIEIDDALMAAAMEAGGFKTKKEAVEEGLRLVRRRQVYEGLLALRGNLQWDDSDEGWARVRAESAQAQAVQEPTPAYAKRTAKPKVAKKTSPTTADKPTARARRKSA
jgi:Arc/MetJ family transcription regulator